MYCYNGDFFNIYLLACSITLVLVKLHAIYIWYYNNCFFVTISLFCVCMCVYICMYVCVYVCTGVGKSVCMYACMYVRA